MFASVWVGSQLTPVGWAADALVLVLTIGGCILLGPHLLEVGALLESFYQKATNAGHNEAQYRSAGEDFAKVVTLLGVDVLLMLVFHVAKAPLNRRVVRIRQGGVEKLPGAKPAEVPVEKPLAEGKGESTAKKPGRLSSELETYAAQGLDRAKLQATYDAAPDKAKFLADLENAPTIYARQELIRDFDNIPGVKKGVVPNNELPKADLPYSDKNGVRDPSLDLPAKEAQNFSEARPKYLKPGTKLYRVVGGSARDTGGYWVTEGNIPKSAGDIIGGTSVDPAWGNGMTEVIEYTVPKEGMTVWEGPASSKSVGEPPSPNHHLPGGDDQIYIPEVYRDYRVPKVLGKFKGEISKHIPIEWKK